MVFTDFFFFLFIHLYIISLIWKYMGSLIPYYLIYEKCMNMEKLLLLEKNVYHVYIKINQKKSNPQPDNNESKGLFIFCTDVIWF